MNFNENDLKLILLRQYIEENGKQYDYSIQPRPFFSIAFIYEGKAELIQDQQMFEVHTGDGLFIPMHSCYKSFWNGDPYTRLITCHFIVSDRQPPIAGKQYRVQKIEPYDGFADDILYLYDHQSDEDLRFDILSRFYKLCGLTFPLLLSTPVPQFSSRIKHATCFIEDHLNTPFAIDDLARECCLSTSYFYSCFKKETGVTPITYRNQRLIEKAQLLLTTEEHLTVEQISESLGFESATFFRRVFKQQTGISPREYRRRQKGM